MNVKARQALEKQIARQCIRDLLAAGYVITVNDGQEDTEVKRSAFPREILKAMMTTDEDYLVVHKPNTPGYYGWVRFIYGNDGYDVINDYTINLEAAIEKTNKLAEKLGD